MYQSNPVFISPDDKTITLWRYMPFSRFVSLLSTSSLWFSRADLFDDVFEGAIPRINIYARKPPDYLSQNDAPVFKSLMDNISFVRHQWRRYVAINCWQMNVSESTAMWELYLGNSEGLAIQSTFNKLRDSFSKTKETIYIGKITYIDYDHQVIENNDKLSPFMYKRKVFEHERELRAVTIIPPPVSKKGLDFTVNTISKGLLIHTDLSVLIDKIFLAPNSSLKLFRLTLAVCKKYGFNFPIFPSQIFNIPRF